MPKYTMSLLRPSMAGRLLMTAVPRGITPGAARIENHTPSRAPFTTTAACNKVFGNLNYVQKPGGTQKNATAEDIPVVPEDSATVSTERAPVVQVAPTIKAEAVGIRHNQPDYTAEVDQASSMFSPTPKRVMNGSEEGETLAAAVLSGAPIELEARTVRIYRPTKTATQSGDWHGHHWRMDWDILPKGHRWENPLMGWQSSADFMQGTHVNFKSKEDAIRFAEKQGYEYYVQEPNARKISPKAYANNFLCSDKKLKHIRTK